jgi:hypothetical protein
MLFWYLIGIVISGCLLALGIIMTWGWLVGIGLVALPAISTWGIISSGPGSPFNPYRHH